MVQPVVRRSNNQQATDDQQLMDLFEIFSRVGETVDEVGGQSQVVTVAVAFEKLDVSLVKGDS